MITVRDVLNLFEVAGVEIVYTGISEGEIEKFFFEELDDVPSRLKSCNDFGFGTSASLKLYYSSYNGSGKLNVEKRNAGEYFLNSR